MKMPKNRNIVLIGFMGTGKTTIGKSLARSLGWTFVDTDELVELTAGSSVQKIFEEQGEIYFRKLETEVLIQVLGSEQQIIATGGGAVLAEHNREVMIEGGLVIALQADISTIIQRVSGDQSRPLLKGDLSDRVAALLEQRKFAYDFADISIQTAGKSVEQIVEVILKKRMEVLD